MLEHATGTAPFFQAMAPILIANVLTVAFVYCFVKIHQRELAGKSEGCNPLAALAGRSLAESLSRLRRSLADSRG